MYEFLSDEWMAAAKELRSKYEDQLPAVEFEVRINQIITDVPFGDGVVHGHIDTSDGSLALEDGHVEEADATITVGYEVARAMIVDRDPQIVMQAFLTGQILVQGDMTKLMALQMSTPPSELAEQLADEVKAITADPPPAEPLDGDPADEEF